MIPTKAPGIPEGEFSACLLPKGSAHEMARGISHLFEHIFILKLLHDFDSSIVSGYTTEDYIILFCYGITPKEIAASMRRMAFTGAELRHHKRILIKEIERESGKDEEVFFRFLWQGTPYEKSPLGTVGDIKTITHAMLEDIRSEITEHSLFFFSESAGIKVFNNSNGRISKPSERKKISWRRNTKFNGRSYNICYINNHIETFHLLTRMLKELNPAKHIQLSEKKNMSAMIFEGGTIFPKKNEIVYFKEKSLEVINREISEIKNQLDETALNELESIYFYNKSWQERIEKLNKTTDLELQHLLGRLNS